MKLKKEKKIGNMLSVALDKAGNNRKMETSKATNKASVAAELKNREHDSEQAAR
jgi:hypothetical protein